MKRYLRIVEVLGLLAPLLLVGAGCNGSSGHVNAFQARLLGNQEMPPVVTEGSGTAVVVLDTHRRGLAVNITLRDLTSPVQQIHLHAGLPGTQGPVLFALFTRANGTALSGSLPTITVTGADLVPAPGLGISTLEEALVAIEEGRAYVNVYTLRFPAGEVRGQLLDVSR
jgi:hypothetical protein